MMEQSAAVERALDALRAVCINEPAPTSGPEVRHASLTLSALPGDRYIASIWGSYVGPFPRCPRCDGYALYRKDNIGTFECLTCDLKKIEESTARRLV